MINILKDFYREENCAHKIIFFNKTHTLWSDLKSGHNIKTLLETQCFKHNGLTRFK